MRAKRPSAVWLAASAAAIALAISAPAETRAATESPAVSQAASRIFVQQAELEGLIGQPGVVVVDVRPKAQYDEGHIEGAISLSWRDIGRSEIDGVRNEFAPDEEIAEALGAAGLSYDDTVILYDGGTLAGRAFVVFEYAGFPNLRVLDGGFGKWAGPVSTEATTLEPAAFELSRKQENRVDQSYVASRIGAGDSVIIDGRQVSAYEDGHIPSAKAVPQSLYLDEQSLLKPADVLLAELAAQGVTPDQEIVSYCGSGVAAANAYLALKDLGFTNVVLYDGSWDEWSRDPRAGQEVALPNYSFDSVALTETSPLGPRFLDDAEVKALQANDDVVVVDVRSPADYRAGRIPGSVNVYWNDTLDDERALQDPEALLKLYADAGVTPDKHVIIFTRGGLQLAHAFTVLKLLGYERVDAFTGHFEGWANASYPQTL